MTVSCTRCAYHFVASEHVGVLGLYCTNCGLFLAVEGSESPTDPSSLYERYKAGDPEARHILRESANENIYGGKS